MSYFRILLIASSSPAASTRASASTTAAAVDRLIQHSVILELNNSSYRMETRKEEKEG